MTNSENRLAEIIEWDRRSLFHRYPLPLRINMMDVPGTLLEKNYAPILGEMRKNIADGETERLLKRLAWLGVDDVVAPGEAELDAELLFRDQDLSFWKLWNTEERNYLVYEPNRLVFDTDLAEPGPVVVREQYWPGWRAFLEDGTEIPVTRTEKVFRGVEVPAGKQRITMVYDPPLLKIGAGLSLLGLAWLFLPFHFGYRRSGAAF